MSKISHRVDCRLFTLDKIPGVHLASLLAPTLRLLGQAMPDTKTDDRRSIYVTLWALALALGWMEGSVVHLRGFGAACTVILLVAGAWLAGGRLAGRTGAFLLLLGVWELTYCAVLRLAFGDAGTLSAWDIVLVPVPGGAPVWMPMAVAALFVPAGSYLFWRPDRERPYPSPDTTVLTTPALVTVVAFLVQSRAAANPRAPERLPIRWFWSAVGLGIGWFLQAEQRATRQRHRHEHGVGARVRPILAGGSGLRPIEARRRLHE